MTSDCVIIRPGLAQAMELLGKWVICRVRWDDEDESHDSGPSQVVGVVVPAPGGPVQAQILLNSKPWESTIGGFELELFLDTLLHVKIVEPPADALRLP